MKKLRKYEEVVKRGIKILDSSASCPPNWKDNIKKEKLSLVSSINCPLGQVYGQYILGLKTLHPLQASNKYYLWDKWAIKNGFSAKTSNYGHESRLLAQEWKRQL